MTRDHPVTVRVLMARVRRHVYDAAAATGDPVATQQVGSVRVGA